MCFCWHITRLIGRCAVSKIEIRCSEMNGILGMAEDESELSSRPEKFLQEFCALSSQNAAPHFNLVIKRGVVQYMHGGMHSSGFGVFGAVHQGSDAGVHHGSCAHGAWFDGHKEVAVSQAVIADCRPGFPQGDNFSVRRWI